MEEQPRPEQEEDLPRPAPESGLPAGGSSIAAGKAPPGTSETEDVRENVVGGPSEETHGPVAPGDEHGSQMGAAAALSGTGETDEEDEAAPTG
ncbi:hypothetical protein [Candidatus Nephthysia bennettiae]|uniref:Uncharacterized protein n=1 Tax=Candidatus Nephthysia bennettiae TaxID=3127016 RepID=A0A934JXK9_9BACT|nr:hypothetical protein [Candidatus Dormibacteraeota bacterium]MBJ7611887.1 hypothetical protein [Candidatus Dormibacteraeota bacterium]